MADLKTSQYPNSVTEVLNDNDLHDISVETSPGVYDSRKAPNSELAGFNIVAELLAQDMGSTTTGDIRPMTWRCTDKEVEAYFVEVKCTTSGKAAGFLTIQIGNSSGGDEVMKLENMTGISAGYTWKGFLSGVTPRLLSAADTFYLKIVEGAANAFTGDVRITARHKNV
jgi:hypothetical protein